MTEIVVCGHSLTIGLKGFIEVRLITFMCNTQLCGAPHNDLLR